MSPDTERKPSAFHPEFTYPIFGDEECVYGYKDLKIKLYYACGSLFLYYGLEYSSQHGAQDIVKMICDYIPHSPQDMTFNPEEFSKQVNAHFAPMGELVSRYRLPDDDAEYQIFNVLSLNSVYICNTWLHRIPLSAAIVSLVVY